MHRSCSTRRPTAPAHRRRRRHRRHRRRRAYRAAPVCLVPSVDRRRFSRHLQSCATPRTDGRIQWFSRSSPIHLSGTACEEEWEKGGGRCVEPSNLRSRNGGWYKRCDESKFTQLFRHLYCFTTKSIVHRGIKIATHFSRSKSLEQNEQVSFFFSAGDVLLWTTKVHDRTNLTNVVGRILFSTFFPRRQSFWMLLLSLLSIDQLEVGSESRSRDFVVILIAGTWSLGCVMPCVISPGFKWWTSVEIVGFFSMFSSRSRSLILQARISTRKEINIFFVWKSLF